MPWKATAVWAYQAKEEGELSFDVGDEIIILEERRNGWWKGKRGGEIGEFPVNYCDVEGGAGGVSSTTSQSAEPVVKIDQEKISGGILALQRKCGFRYGSGDDDEEGGSSSPRGLTSFEELQQKLGIQAFNPLEGLLKDVAPAATSSSSSKLMKASSTDLDLSLTDDDDEVQQDDDEPDTSLEMSRDYLLSSQEVWLSPRSPTAVSPRSPAVSPRDVSETQPSAGDDEGRRAKRDTATATPSSDRQHSSSSSGKRGSIIRGRKGSSSELSRAQKAGKSRRDTVAAPASSTAAAAAAAAAAGSDGKARKSDKDKAFGSASGMGRRSMSDFRLSRADSKLDKSKRKKKEEASAPPAAAPDSGEVTSLSRSLRFALPDIAIDNSEEEAGPVEASKPGTPKGGQHGQSGRVRHRKSKSQATASWFIEATLGKAAESKTEEEGAGISLRELMSGRRNSETAASTVMAVTSAPDRKAREETGEMRSGSPVPRSAQLSKPQTASKVSKRWAKKLTQLGGRADALQQVQRLLLAQSHGSGSPIFGKALRDIIHDLEIAQKNEDTECIVTIFAMMIVLQEAYQKQKDSELELANRKRAESDRELAEERSKNQSLAKQERDLLKLLQQTQEKVVEKSKSSSRAENNKQNYKQKLDEEEERRQVLEKELKKQKQKAKDSEKEIARLESELAKAKGKEPKRKGSARAAQRLSRAVPAGLSLNDWDLGDDSNPAD
ncbi:SH3 domain containing protein [Acanthamoeba castellanii str. Neff]|uniref:SH3 domain containing protein n=1 Tax=Acanthamoeba castellanii (strain ATCC 30010 / Neff) TaxID=1257118 RepID=L8HK19_ACACF|nr:SH3 domain containing protein [Acanthamoeba castellanii str. Neff]ELR24736.1 SH3 domain containing protein [Acanthamoeba castellanii str. Neff]